MAIAAHDHRTAQEPAALNDLDDVQPYERPRGFPRRHRLEDDGVEAMDAAIVEDRRQSRRLVSRSWFLREAVSAAAATASRADHGVGAARAGNSRRPRQ